jgi:pimeloyl-ACP methyl ester carboxylesterase
MLKVNSRWFLPLVIVVLSAPAIPGQSIADRVRLVMGQCKLSNVMGKTFCGTFKVPEDRSRPTKRTINLKLVVLSADNEVPKPDALFIIAGGPGQAATDNVDFYARIFRAVRKERDIVLVDQRGTGGSNQHTCDLYGKTVQGHLNDLLPLDAVKRCLKEWRSHADLRFYTTPTAMADLNELREALGYFQIDIFGTSYGTRAAQFFLRQYPAQVRSVILKGVTPITENIPTVIAPDAQNSLEKVFADCEANSTCQKAYPKLREEFTALLKRFDTGPISISYTSTDNKTEAVKLSRGAVVTTIRSLLQSTATIAQLPQLIHEAYQEKYTGLIKSIVSIRDGFSSGVGLGVFLAVVRSEDLPFVKSAEVQRLARGTFMGDYYYQQLRSASSLLPRAQVPADYKSPVSANVPVLLLSGYLDPATPPDNGEEVASTLTNRKHVVIRYGSHSYSSLSPCVDELMSAFIDAGRVEGLDTGCVGAIAQTPWAVP